MHLIGIDPGLTGAFILMSSDGEVVDVADIPVMAAGKGGTKVKNIVNYAATFSILSQWVEDYGVAEAWIESVGSRPTDGVAAAFSFGMTFGALRAIVACTKQPLNLVTPGTWKKYFKLPSADKEVARGFAINQFPEATKFLTRKKDHNRAEAILIAYYGLQHRQKRGG